MVKICRSKKNEREIPKASIVTKMTFHQENRKPLKQVGHVKMRYLEIMPTCSTLATYNYTQAQQNEKFIW